MVNIVPGAIWNPVDVGSRAARRKGRGLIGHVAVSGAVNLPPSGSPATRQADWHFYLPKNPQPGGRFFQYIDLNLQSWSSMQANADTASFESQGGLGTAAQVNAEPWTDNQIESAAIILAYLNETEGVPLQDMVNSLPGSRGFGVHRYGIDPWRVPGGQTWSNPGKLCPGDTKVRQVPVIVSRAKEIRGGSPTPPAQEDDVMLVRDNDNGTVYVYDATSMVPIPDNPTYGAYQHAGAVPRSVPHSEILLIAAQVQRGRDALKADLKDYIWTVPAQPRGGIDGKGTPDGVWPADRVRGTDINAGEANAGVKALNAKVDALTKEVEALKVGGVDEDALASKLADKLAARLKD